MTSTVSRPEDVLAGVPGTLRSPLLEEFRKVARNFAERRWEPAELNGGKLCEIVYSILRGHVDGTFPAAPYKPTNMVDACADLAKADKTRFPRSVRIQIPRMLVALYEVRNNRNVGHVGGDVDPNHQDAAVVLGMCQWIMAELVRVFHAVDMDTAREVVDALVDRAVPLVWRVNGRFRVLAPSMSARDKTLVVLYSSVGSLSSVELAEAVEYKNMSRFREQILAELHQSKLIDYDPRDDRVTLSPLGSAHVDKTIKLTL